jgi:hypothetical protein
MGGVYNTINAHLYHYAGNNPVKYTDPDGRIILPTRGINGNNFYQQDSSRYIAGSNTKVSAEGCYATANARVINSINAVAKAMDSSIERLPPIGVDFTISQNEYFDYDNLNTETSGAMINKFTVFETSTTRVTGKIGIKDTLQKYANSKTEHAAIVGKINVSGGSHFLNIEGIQVDANGSITVGVYDTSNKNRTNLPISELTAIEVTTWKPFGTE